MTVHLAPAKMAIAVQGKMAEAVHLQNGDGCSPEAGQSSRSGCLTPFQPCQRLKLTDRDELSRISGAS